MAKPKEHPAGSVDADLLAQAREIAQDTRLPLAVREGMVLALHDKAVELAQLKAIMNEYARKEGYGSTGKTA